MGIVPVPDPRLDELAKIDHPAKIVPATVEFVDIAGLVAGASQGEGLGQPVPREHPRDGRHLRGRALLSDPDVTHVAGKVNPQSDVDTIKTELILADIATIEKAIPRLEKDAKRDKAGVLKLETAKKALAGLNEGHRARTLDLTEDEIAALYDLHLLTMKPMLYVANVDEDAVAAELEEIDGCVPVPICAKVEADIAELAEMDPDEAKEYMEALGLSESGLARLINAAYRLLGLQSYFTVRRDRDARLDHTRGREGAAGGRRHPYRLRARLHQGRDRQLRGLRWRWAARRAAAMPASCARRARSTSSRTATSCTFKFNV